MAWVKTVRQTHLSWSMDLRTELQATETYLVVFDAPATPIAAETATGVPVRGNSHPDDPTRFFKQKRPQCVENSNRMHWQVQVDYSSTVDTFGADPTKQPAQIEWDYSNGTEAYAIDHASMYGQTADQAVTNTAGEPLPAERDAGTWSATYTANVAETFTIATEINVMQVVNDGPFTFDGQEIAQYAAKISGGSLSAVQVQNGYRYRVLTYKLKFKNGGWIDYLANVGYQEADGHGGRTNIMTKGTPDHPAQPTQLPWPLDEDGVSRPDATTTPDKLSFYPYLPMSFSGLFTIATITYFNGGAGG